MYLFLLGKIKVILGLYSYPCGVAAAACEAATPGIRAMAAAASKATPLGFGAT
jgi:hypothetical protein